MAGDGPVAYSQAARPGGFSLALRLDAGRLVLESGMRRDEVALGAVEVVRLTYETRSLAGRAFQTSLRARGGRRIRFTSVSWRSMTRVEEQAGAYRAFLLALLPAIARQNPSARFLAGKPAPVWYAVAALAALAAAGVGLFIGGAVGAGQWGAGLFGLAVAAGGTWQVAPFILRNRPRVFTPDALPADLLP